MRNHVLLIFDEHYSSKGHVVHAAACGIFQQLGTTHRYSVFTRGKYHGPNFDNTVDVNVSGTHVYRYNCSMRLRDRIRRKFAEMRIVEGLDRWISNVDAADEALLLALREVDGIHAVIVFSTDPAFGLKWIRIAHIFATSQVPHLIVVTPASVVDPQIADDIRWLSGRILRDRFPSYPTSVSVDPSETAVTKRVGSVPDTLANVLETFSSFDAPVAYEFVDQGNYPYRFGSESTVINWFDWLPADRAYAPRVKNVVLFMRPDWMKCGSGTTFNNLARWFRTNDSLLIDIAVWPYPVSFDADARDMHVAEEQKEIGAALFFSARRGTSIGSLMRVLITAFRWKPRTVVNQHLLQYVMAVQPGLMCSALAAAKFTHIYLNHYFTFAYASRFIAGRKFLLDTHDIQSINFVHAGTSNIITRQGDEFTKMLAEEMAVLRLADHVCFVSEEERDIAARHLPHERLSAFIPLPDVLPKPRRPVGRPPRLLLVASANLANQQSVAWFLRNVWPDVLRHYDSATPRGRKPPSYPQLDICGNISTMFQDVEAQGVRFHGVVEDLSTSYHYCDIVLLPVVTGSGVAIKTIEALLYECPVIATRHALRGLSTEIVETVGSHDEPGDFARQIIDTLASDKLHAQRTDRSRKAAHILRDAGFYERLGAAMQSVRLDDVTVIEGPPRPKPE